MPSRELPVHADLGQLRRQAKELRDAAAAGEAAAPARVAAVSTVGGGGLLLTQAQLVIAREHGFPSWARLKLHLEHARASFAERVAQFLESACIVSAQGRGDARRARGLLQHDPAIAGAGLACALVAGELEAARRLIAREPALAKAATGPRQWPPLLYVCFSSVLAEPSRWADALALARLLLAHGADADARFAPLPDDPGYSESALSGACGVAGHAELMRLLIGAGARVDGDQSAYCAVERGRQDCLELLLEHRLPIAQLSLFHLLDQEDEAGLRRVLGLGADCRSPGYSGETPLHWAIKRGRSLGILRLLIEHGAEVDARIPQGRTVFPTLIASTPLDLALRTLDARAYDLLLERGARPRALDAGERLLLACGRGDRDAMRAVIADHPGLVAHLPEEDLRALPRAAARGDTTAVALLLEAGFPTTTKDWMGGTALHHAAMCGRLGAAQALIAGGSELDDRENSHRSTPLGWAQWGSEHEYGTNADYAGVVEALIAAGATLPESCAGSAGVAAVLARHQVPD